ncbi:hypothetical protein Pmani_027269 [Petrolisthes manimaculis]|uniref:Uncharacterized protein n=1 Tax=Petrolisthes manimaculis TaxID=1843537 RepID=A0AAE1TWN2_9EUCA|nr:hypothetical protein Pmani_027269 [Petrolisthes manimaculis]
MTRSFTDRFYYYHAKSGKNLFDVKKRVKSIEDGMGLVLKGGFAFIYSTYYGKMLVATHYTEQTGDTPVHISTSQYDLFFGNSFGMR